jgi:starch synthase
VPPLKVLVVASECAPFVKTGGLGDVVGALPKALRELDIDVRIVLPLYAGIPWNDLEALEGTLRIPMWYGAAESGVRLGHLDRSDVPVYFLEYHRYFDRPHPYGPPDGGYADNLERFALLSRGALELCKALGWIPDVIHANDWQSGLVPVYLNTVEWAQPLHGTASLYTIHNLAYQGEFDEAAMRVTSLGPEHYNAAEFEHFGAMNVTKAALYHSTLLSTVSPTYAREIKTGEYGCGLDGVLEARSADLFGILNGIDGDEWNPASDAHLPARFDVSDLSGKAICKAALQREAGLPVRSDVPLFTAIGRLGAQKGTDVLAEALDRLLSWDLQVVVLGTGDPDAEQLLARISGAHRDRLCTFLEFDSARAHRIEAGGDFFLMPSRFEPCGLSQMYSLRYGTLPVVRATGGLVDTVSNYDEATGGGTGFVFEHLGSDSLADTVGWATSTWYERPEHVELMRRRGMRRDFSWRRAARDYEALYRRAYQLRRGHKFP